MKTISLNRPWTVLCAAVLSGLLLCANTLSAQNPKTLIIGSTTSLQDSGLLDVLIPAFNQATGINAKVIAVGTGQAMKMGKDGEADVLLVHAKESELQFMADGHGTRRQEVMYNDFVVVGPAADPAHLKTAAGNDIVKAFSLIKKQNSPFISRGDNSGTHQKELSIWKKAGESPQFSAYVSTGRGMGDVLKVADEKMAYTLTDRGTYAKMAKNLDLVVLVEGDPFLINMYGVIAVNPAKNAQINATGAQQFIDWLISVPIQTLIGNYGKEIYGGSLFIPCAAAGNTK